jgi:hypothetical protein
VTQRSLIDRMLYDRFDEGLPPCLGGDRDKGPYSPHDVLTSPPCLSLCRVSSCSPLPPVADALQCLLQTKCCLVNGTSQVAVRFVRSHIDSLIVVVVVDSGEVSTSSHPVRRVQKRHDYGIIEGPHKYPYRKVTAVVIVWDLTSKDAIRNVPQWITVRTSQARSPTQHAC